MIRGIILDLDGTVYLGKKEVPGVVKFIGEMTAAGIRCLYVTNRTNRAPSEISEQLRGFGIACRDEDVLTSAQATVECLKKGTVFFTGEEPFRAELERAGFVITDKAPDYVIISFERNISRPKILKAAELIKKGARFVATNPDKGLKIENGILPGTGAIVEAVQAEVDVEPLMIGKPEKIIFEMSLRRLGMNKDEVIAVGDNIDTDVPAGAKAGMRTALVLTGISTKQDVDKAAIKPTWLVINFEDLADIIKAENNL